MTPVTVSELKTVVKSFLQSDFPAVEEHPLFAQGDSANVTATFDMLFLQAVNNAIRRAEMGHDFGFMSKSLEGTIPSGDGGLSMTGLTVYGGGTTHDVKVIERVWCRGADDALVPARHESRGRLADRLIELGDAAGYGEANGPVEGRFLVYGDKLFVYPTNQTEATNVVIDANVWATKVTAVTNTSEFVTYGFEYMQWATVVELNHLFKTFVPRQEGNLDPPKRERDDALRRLIDWDVAQVEANRNVILD